jgi:hypothetical protein
VDTQLPAPEPVPILLLLHRPIPKLFLSSVPMLSHGTLQSWTLATLQMLTSCGISCRRMAMVVRSPICGEDSLSLWGLH